MARHTAEWQADYYRFDIICDWYCLSLLFMLSYQRCLYHQAAPLGVQATRESSLMVRQIKRNYPRTAKLAYYFEIKYNSGGRGSKS